MQDYNITSKEGITLNSGFVDESQNDVMKQILLSEFVWVDDSPASVKTSNLDYKTSLNDKMINYTLEFEYSNNTIINIY